MKEIHCFSGLSLCDHSLLGWDVKLLLRFAHETMDTCFWAEIRLGSWAIGRAMRRSLLKPVRVIRTFSLPILTVSRSCTSHLLTQWKERCSRCRPVGLQHREPRAITPTYYFSYRSSYRPGLHCSWHRWELFHTRGMALLHKAGKGTRAQRGRKMGEM